MMSVTQSHMIIYPMQSFQQTRITALECIGRLLKNLDKMIILEEVLPFLADIQCSEAEIIMAVIGKSGPAY